MGDAQRRSAALGTVLLLVLAALVGLILWWGDVAGFRSMFDRERRGGGGGASSTSSFDDDDARSTTSRSGKRKRAAIPGTGSGTSGSGGGSGRAGPGGSTDGAGADPTDGDGTAAGATATAGTAAANPFQVVTPDPDASADDFGSRVAIDGDLAVIAAPGTAVGAVSCGAAFVFERKDGTWTQVARIDSPRPDLPGFATGVGASGRRIVVFGGMALGVNEPVFRSYVRLDGAWKQESEVTLGTPLVRGVTAMTGSSVAVGVGRTVQLFDVDDTGHWREPQVIAAPREVASSRFGSCVLLQSDTLAVGSDGDDRVCVFRRTDREFVLERVLKLDAQRATLARGGAALLWSSELRVNVDGRGGKGWERMATAKLSEGKDFLTLGPFAADGDLVVTGSTTRKRAGMQLFEHRDDGWHTASWTPRGAAEGIKGHWGLGGNLAVSGRTVVAGLPMEGTSGAAWFMEVTDADLARATKLESGLKKQ